MFAACSVPVPVTAANRQELVDGSSDQNPGPPDHLPGLPPTPTRHRGGVNKRTFATVVKSTVRDLTKGRFKPRRSLLHLTPQSENYTQLNKVKSILFDFDTDIYFLSNFFNTLYLLCPNFSDPALSHNKKPNRARLNALRGYIKDLFQRSRLPNDHIGSTEAAGKVQN